ncbi:uncharacterized protein LOC124340741 [Daphnia pulicaria]|uniref:uncharacterized protein LOC124340741 n=1 Tax=Daphnia pulicaria TaxID=35523 RepID=UPI001EEAD0F1|nr:uncharacterized protein LOC124340741 [Daphnia pulicaria]
MIEPDVLCATKLEIDKGLSTPSGDDLNQQSCLPLMAKDDDKNLTVLENERLENELSLLQSKLTDSSSKLQMFQNVHDELGTTKSELEEKKREISDIKEKNLRLKNDDSQLRREIKDRDNLIASSRAELENLRVCLAEQQLDTRELAVATRELESKNRTISELETKNLRLAENDSQMRRKMEDTNRLLLSSKAEVEELRASLNNQTDTIEQLGDQMSSLTPRNGEEVGIKVEKPNEMLVKEQFEMLQNNPKSLNFQTREAIYATESLSNEMQAENQELEAPEEPVSKPKDIPVEERPSNQQLEMDEKKPKPESLPEIIDDIENISNKDPVLGKTELTEITEETIINEESEQVEEQSSKAQSNKSTDNQFLHKHENPQVQSQIPEKPELLNDQTLDEKPEEPSPEIVSKPKETPAEVPPSNEQLETDEKKPEPKSLNENLQKTIDDGKNMTNKDPVLGETELLEMAEETIIPKESEQVEQQPSKAQSKTTDNQPRQVPKDSHALPSNPEKSQLPQKQNGAMDEKAKAPEPLRDCKQGKRTPKHFKIKVVRGVNFPEAKDSDKYYYVSMRLEEWHGMNRVQFKKIKTKIIHGSQPQWNQNFTIKTRNPEKWVMVIKLKKLSKWGLKTSITVFSFVICVSQLKVNEINRLKLYDCYSPVGHACLEVEYKIDYLPEVIPSSKIVSEPKETPAEVPPSNEHELETDEKNPEPKNPTENLQQTIDDGKNVTNEDAVGDTELLEKAKETILEESEQVEEQPSKAQFRDNYGDPQVQSQIPEKPELLNDQTMDEKPEEPSPEIVSKPKDTPEAVEPASNEQFETDEKRPEPESLNENLQQTIDDTRNVTKEDPVVETKLLEIAEETIIPEEIEQVEEQPSKAKSNKSADNQFRNKPGDRQVLPSNSEKSQLPQKQNGAMDEEREVPQPLPVCEEGNQKPLKHFKIRFLRGDNLPKAKDSDQYYVSMRVEQCRSMNRVQDNKIKTKTIRGSQPEWNKDFTIKTHNPEECRMTIKVKKSSILGLKTSTVGFVKLDLSSLDDGLNKLQLYDKSYNPVGKACLEVEIEYLLPVVIPSPVIVSKPKETSAEIPSSNERFEIDEKRPEPESLSDNLQQTIDDTGNMTNEDPVVETKLLEIAKETIIPEKSEQVEEQPSKAKSNKSADNQFRNKPGDRQVLPSNSEKSNLFNKKDNQPRHVPKDPHASPPNPEKSDCHPGKCDCEPRNPYKEIKIRVIGGVNLPEAKDNYYVSLRAEATESWFGLRHVQSRKFRTKTIHGSQPKWNKKMIIAHTQYPENWMFTIKLKKSILGLKTSTVGSAVFKVSNLMKNQVNTLQLYDESDNPVGKSCVELEIKIKYPLTEVISRPEIVSEHKDTPMLGETDLLEIAEETIIPEESEQVEEQPSKAQSNTTDNQFGHITKDLHVLPPNREKSQLLQNRATDEKPEAAPKQSVCGHPDCEEGNRTAPKNFQIKVVRGVNFPDAKDSDEYYVSIRVEEWIGLFPTLFKKIKTETIRGSQPEWNEDYIIKTKYQYRFKLIAKVKKLSNFGLRKSTVGFVKLRMSTCDEGLTQLQLYDKSKNRVGDACLEVEIHRPAEVKRQKLTRKAK